MQADRLVLHRPEKENVTLNMYDHVKIGKPFVVTSIPAHTAILSKKSAFLVKPPAEALTNRLLQVLQNSHHAEKLALEVKSISKTYSNDSLERAIIESYHHVPNLKI